MTSKEPDLKQNKHPDLKQKILSLLVNYTLSTREISEEIGATYATTLKYLEILHASSLVENKVYGKTKVWALKKKDPFDLEVNSLLYLLIKNLSQTNKGYDRLQEILWAFYSKNIEDHVNKLKNKDVSDLIEKYLEIEQNKKWKDVEGYDIPHSNTDELQIQIFDCKYKFGTCANLQEDHIEIYCIMGQKFPCLLSKALGLEYRLKLIEFNLDPNNCKILLTHSKPQ